MKGIYKLPGKPAEIIEIENTLQALQEYVGGYIESVTIAEDAVIICNEEGRLAGMKENCTICGLNFVGPILVLGVQGDNFANLKDPEMVKRLLFREEKR